MYIVRKDGLKWLDLATGRIFAVDLANADCWRKKFKFEATIKTKIVNGKQIVTVKRIKA